MFCCDGVVKDTARLTNLVALSPLTLVYETHAYVDASVMDYINMCIVAQSSVEKSLKKSDSTIRSRDRPLRSVTAASTRQRTAIITHCFINTFADTTRLSCNGNLKGAIKYN